jgi:hypothetical protein
MISKMATTGLPEFSLANKVILVSGAARGLGLTQAEALLEAGAKGIYMTISSLTGAHSETPNPLTIDPQSTP